MNTLWKLFVVTLRLFLCYPFLAGLGVTLGIILIPIGLILLIPFLLINVLALILAIIGNDKKWSMEIMTSTIEDIKEYTLSIIGGLLAPITALLWSVEPFFYEKKEDD